MPARPTVYDSQPPSARAGVVRVATVDATGLFSVLPRPLINTARISGSEAAVPVTLKRVNTDGTINSASGVSCTADDDAVAKIDASCSKIFGDGSESDSQGGMAIFQASLGELSLQFEVQVYQPTLPLTPTVVDPILNAVQGYNDPAQACRSRYQQTDVRFKTTFVAGSSTIANVDVTGLVQLGTSAASGLDHCLFHPSPSPVASSRKRLSGQGQVLGILIEGHSPGYAYFSSSVGSTTVVDSFQITVSNAEVIAARLDVIIVASIDIAVSSDLSEPVPVQATISSVGQSPMAATSHCTCRF